MNELIQMRDLSEHFLDERKQMQKYKVGVLCNAVIQSAM